MGETSVLDQLTPVFSGIVSDVVEFVVGFLPIIVPLLILAIGIPLAIRFIRQTSPK